MIGGVLKERSLGLALLLLAPCSAKAQAPPAAPTAHPRLVLALSGGGARGIAHIGVLRALEENGIVVDGIAGTSMGALVGALYASGYRAKELRTVVVSFDWNNAFSGRPDRVLVPLARRLDEEPALLSLGFEPWKVLLPASALSDYGIGRFLIRHLAGPGYLAGGDFDRLPIPFRAVAARLDNAERVVLARGDLARATRASLSIPIFFPPVDWEGTLLVDGGVADNIPVGVARGMGADVVLAVDVTSPPLEPSEWRTLTGVGAQVSDALIEARNQTYRETPDFQIRPDLGRHRATEYVGFEGLIERGYAATLSIIGPLKERLGAIPPPPAPPAAGRALEGAPIVEVAVEGNQRTSRALIRRTFSIPLGRPFDMEKGLNALDRIFATSFFDSCWMSFEPSADGGGLRIILRVQEAARRSLRLSAGYNEPEQTHARVRLQNQNAFGFGERLEAVGAASEAQSEISLGLDSDRLFKPVVGYSIRAGWREDKPRLFKDGVLLNRARFDRKELLLSLTRALKRTRLLQAGILLGSVETQEQPAVPYPPAADKARTLVARYVEDNLDDLYFPARGWRIDLAASRNAPGLGATHDYWRGELSARVVSPAGSRVTVEADIFGGLSGRDLPVYEWFRLGGPVLIPGLHADELWGPQGAGAAAAVSVRLDGLRVRGRVGAGNVWPSRSEIQLNSLRVGFGLGVFYPTRFGPLGLDFGVTTDGRSLWSLTVGYP
jgi:NTE family protein